MADTVTAGGPELVTLRTRVGVDVARVSDISHSLSVFGERYATRIFTDSEIATCGLEGVVSARRLAARFAAKEALFKILLVADQPFDWREIDVRTMPGGWPQIRLEGRAAELADQAGVLDTSLSLTHDDDVAMAVVVATIDDGYLPRPATHASPLPTNTKDALHG